MGVAHGTLSSRSGRQAAAWERRLGSIAQTCAHLSACDAAHAPAEAALLSGAVPNPAAGSVGLTCKKPGLHLAISSCIVPLARMACGAGPGCTRGGRPARSGAVQRSAGSAMSPAARTCCHPSSQQGCAHLVTVFPDHGWPQGRPLDLHRQLLHTQSAVAGGCGSTQRVGVKAPSMGTAAAGRRWQRSGCLRIGSCKRQRLEQGRAGGTIGPLQVQC